MELVVIYVNVFQETVQQDIMVMDHAHVNQDGMENFVINVTEDFTHLHV